MADELAQFIPRPGDAPNPQRPGQFLDLEDVAPPKPRKSQKLTDPAYEWRMQNQARGKNPPHSDPDDFHPLDVTTEQPANEDDLKSWYETLSDTNKRMVKEFQDALKSRGLQGWFDPKISGSMLKARNKLFDLSSQKWQHSKPEYKQQQQEFRRKRGGETEDEADEILRPKKKSENLGQEVPNGVAALGGRAMVEEA